MTEPLKRCRDCQASVIVRSLWFRNHDWYCVTDFQIRFGFSPIGSGIAHTG